MSLEDIREKKHSKIVYIIIGFLLIGMAGFGTSQFGIGTVSGSQTLLSTGNSEVTLTQYEDTLRYVQQNNPKISIDKARAITIAGLRERLVLSDYINRYPFSASNKQVDIAIIKNPAFFDNGKFSEKRFKEVVRTSPEAYRKSLSEDIAINDLQKSIINTSVVSKAELLPYLEMQNMERDIEVAKIPVSDFSTNVTDVESKIFYRENKDKFMTPEKYNIQYIDFNPSEIIKSTIINEKDLSAAMSPPREAKYYLFKNKEKAEDAVNKVASGEKMEDLKLAPAGSIDDSGDLGELSGLVDNDSAIPQVAVDKIFALNNVGDVTEPIKIDGSFYIFELTGVSNKKIDEGFKKDTKLKLQKEKSKEKIVDLGEKLNKSVFEVGAPTLKSISDATGLSVNVTGLQTIKSKNSIFNIPKVVESITNSKKDINKLQEPITIGDRVIVYRFADVKKPSQKSYDDVKQEVNKILKSRKIKNKIKKVVNTLIKDTKSEGLEKVAKKHNYKFERYKNFTAKTDENSILDPITNFMIFRETPQIGNDNAKGIFSTTGDAYVYVTNKVSLGKKDNKEYYQRLYNSLKEQTGGMQFASFLGMVMSNTKIKDMSSELIK